MLLSRIRQLVCVALALTFLFTAFTPIQRLIAAIGDLDPSFGSGGVATAPLGTGAYGYSVAVQADGKIVAAGPGGDPTPNAAGWHRADLAVGLSATDGNGSGSSRSAFLIR